MTHPIGCEVWMEEDVLRNAHLSHVFNTWKTLMPFGCFPLHGAQQMCIRDRSGALRLSGHHRRSPGRGAPLRRHRLAHHRGDRPSLHSRITARYLYDNALSHLRHRHSPHSGRVCPAGRQAWAAPLPVRPAGCPRGLHRRQRRLRHHGPQGGRCLLYTSPPLSHWPEPAGGPPARWWRCGP